MMLSVNKKRRLSIFSRDKTLSLSEWIQHPVAYVFIGLLTLFFSVLITELGIPFAVLLLCFIVGIPVLYGVIAHPTFGLIVLLVSSFLVMEVIKTGVDFPVGTLMDGLEFFLIIGLILKHKYDRGWEFVKSPISAMIMIWIIYNFMEVINPIAESRLAWLYTIRTAAVVMLTYFMFSYHIKSVDFIRSILKVWIVLSLIAAIYTIKQEYFGFFSFENQWLAEEPGTKALFYIGDHWRKFSIFSDPVVLAYNMAVSSAVCITLMLGPCSKLKKLGLFACAVLCIIAMLYSGTRGAFVLLPASLGFLFLIKFNIKLLLPAIIVICLIVVAVKIPTSNITLARFQSAFKPSTDASFNVRRLNQKRIQPYIQAHPIGGGLGSTGVWGARFSPNSYLASFPPDSGYVRVAVETGWIGLFIICMLFFTILRTGVKNYFKIIDPELKNYCLAMVIAIFALCIGNYPQEAFIQYPTNILFYLIVALIGVTFKLDKEMQLRNQLVFKGPPVPLTVADE